MKRKNNVNKMKQRFIQIQLKVGAEDRVARTKSLIAVFCKRKTFSIELLNIFFEMF